MKRNDVYIFFLRRDTRKLQEEAFEPLPEIACIGEFIVYDEHSSFGAVKKCL